MRVGSLPCQDLLLFTEHPVNAMVLPFRADDLMK
eukprot:Cvel_20911.t1-p1 / transcript=Cvel_20911.t1 / gene=Cvel_20911 / organism=Chromera_velia_CCMP2878 / gene_product=hypothetical protein / transcript_product=hypothetical protein / location=Cvel_scaffold1918:32202-34950(+) / protein_length=33 / sequence_SO=supercontig / SO=protein_coding / is_pseudo=false